MNPMLDLTQTVSLVRTLATQPRAFTTDDVWARIAFRGDGRMIANAMIAAERRGYIRNSYIGAYLRGSQAHRRWLSIWLSTTLNATANDAADYAARLASGNARS